jgi:hypothetical protein
MRSRAPITPENVRAFLQRPWAELAELKERHWREALQADPLATFKASASLWEVLRATGHTVDPQERQADLEAHLRLRALLDRTANVRAR